MSIQSKYDLALFGNITLDHIYTINGWPASGTSNSFESNKNSVGGLGNIIESLDGRLKTYVEGLIGNDIDGKYIEQYMSLKNNLDCKLIKSIKSTTKAVIFSDIKDNERTSFVNWGCGFDSFKPTPVETEWAHISYLDVIKNINIIDIRKTCKTLSADFCLSTPSKLPDLNLFDVLFLSETEAKVYEQQIKDFNGTIICHTRTGTWITSSAQTPSYLKSNHTNIDNINVLGAGDAYCSGFILNRLKGATLRGAALAAHEEATGFLLKRKGL